MPDREIMPELTVLPKDSEDCSLDCVYCYAGNKTKKNMDYSTLEKMIKVLERRECVKSTSYIWHGAEPLTAGLDFYKEAVRLQKIYGKDHQISNSMQTNGVLLTPEIADYFVENNIHVGFSLDGPQKVHDQTRRYTDQRSSFEDTMRAINLMQEKGEKPGVIAVLTKASLPYLDEIYDFFKSEKLSFKINPIMNCGTATRHQNVNLTPHEKVEAIKYIFDKWFFDEDKENRVSYDSAMNVATAIFKGGGNSCDMAISCQDSFISIGADGSIFPCSRYSEREMSYGNIHSVLSFEEIVQSSLRQKLLKRYENLQECNECDYNKLCYAGCMHNAYIAGDIMKKDPNCSINKPIYEHISKRILDQLKKEGIVKNE